ALLVESVTIAGTTGLGNKTTAVSTGDGVLVLTAGNPFLAQAATEHAGISSNSLTGGGNQPTCLVRVAGDVVAEGNQCDHEGGEQPTAMLLTARTITASTNRARGTRARIVL